MGKHRKPFVVLPGLSVFYFAEIPAAEQQSYAGLLEQQP